MSAQAIRSLVDELLNATPFDVLSGETLTIRPPSNDIGSLQIGNGTTNFDFKVNLSSTAYVLFDVGNLSLTLVGVSTNLNGTIAIEGNSTITGNQSVTGNSIITGNQTVHGNTTFLGRVTGSNGLPVRYELQWIAGGRGKPGINADIQNADEAVRMITDPDFEVLGTNADTSTVTRESTGGITLTTKTTANDQVIIVPHLDANQSSWATTNWGTPGQVTFETLLLTDASITAMVIWAGLKLTNTSVTATDDDQIFFRFEDIVNTGKWQAVSSIAGVDSASDSGVTVIASTPYHLKITIDDNRIARMYINGTLVKTTTQLTATNLIPYVGIQTTDASAAICILRGSSISKIY